MNKIMNVYVSVHGIYTLVELLFVCFSTESLVSVSCDSLKRGCGEVTWLLWAFISLASAWRLGSCIEYTGKVKL
jgi:hypothetical protein